MQNYENVSSQPYMIKQATNTHRSKSSKGVQNGVIIDKNSIFNLDIIT